MSRSDELGSILPGYNKWETENFNRSVIEENLCIARKSLDYSKRSCESAEKAEALSRESLKEVKRTLKIAIATLVVAVLTLGATVLFGVIQLN